LKWAGCLFLAVILAAAPAACGRKPYEGKTVAQLENMAANVDPKVQAQGLFGLSQHGADAKAALPALMKALNSSDVLVRQQAALALGKIGAEAGDAVPALVKALADPEWSVRRQSAVSLGQIGPAPALVTEPLQQCTRDANTLVRKAAKEALLSIQKKAGAKQEG
jgi:HEAT repeat protein